MHWVLTPTLKGAYQYFVNYALPNLGEFRTLWRLDNKTFTTGYTDERNEPFVPLSDIVSASKTQDETWQRSDGTFITKYDLSAFLPIIEGSPSFWGVHGKLDGKKDGEGIGSWYIHGGKDYFNGDHTKQELMVHRESQLGDAVQLNMIHGTHFQAGTSDAFPKGKTWGPWLWYLVFTHTPLLFAYTYCLPKFETTEQRLDNRRRHPRRRRNRRLAIPLVLRLLRLHLSRQPLGPDHALRRPPSSRRRCLPRRPQIDPSPARPGHNLLLPHLRRRQWLLPSCQCAHRHLHAAGVGEWRVDRGHQHCVFAERCGYHGESGDEAWGRDVEDAGTEKDLADWRGGSEGNRVWV